MPEMTRQGGSVTRQGGSVSAGGEGGRTGSPSPRPSPTRGEGGKNPSPWSSPARGEGVRSGIMSISCTRSMSTQGTSLRFERNTSEYFRALRLLEANPVRSQRELAEELGVSVGTVNKLLKTLVDNRHLQPLDTTHPERTGKKCAYRLTPAGIQHRLALTRDYLELKTKEFEALHAEVTSLRAELGMYPTSPLAGAGPGERRNELSGGGRLRPG